MGAGVVGSVMVAQTMVVIFTQTSPVFTAETTARRAAGEVVSMVATIEPLEKRAAGISSGPSPVMFLNDVRTS